MPLHSIQRLSPTAVLGLWHLTETPAELWAGLPWAEAYRALLPSTAPAPRQAQWLGGRALVHALLAERGAPTPAPAPTLLVQNDASGRPWLTGEVPGPVVSLSHSGVWVAAVLATGGRVGVDIELIRDKARRLAGKFLAPAEWAAAEAATHAAPEGAASTHYTLLWSAKETLYKLAGQRGIIFKEQLLLSAFAPAPAGKIAATLQLPHSQTRHCICYHQPAPGYVLTYCHEPAA